MGFQLCEGILDRIEIGTVGRQVQQSSPTGFDSFPDASNLVGGQIVHDDKVIRPQDRREHLLAPGPEAIPVHRSVEHHRSDEAGKRQSADEGHSLPVSVGDSSAAALAFGRPTPKACHLGRQAAFVDEDQVFGTKRGLLFDPLLAGCLYVGALLLAGMRSLFLCVWP